MPFEVSTMCSPGRYVWQLGALTAACLALITTFNILVDPYQVFRNMPASPLDPYKFCSLERTAKAEIAASGAVDVLLVGDSRVMIGLDSTHPSLSRFGTVHNLAFPSGTVYEGLRIIELAQQARPPRLVVWGFDPHGINAIRFKWSYYDFEVTRLNPELDVWRYYRLHLTAFSTIKESVMAVLRAVVRPHMPCARNGQRLTWCRPQAEYAIEFAKILAQEVETAGQVSPNANSGVMQLRPLLERCHMDGTRVILFFPPAHATRLEVLYRTDNLRRHSEAATRELVLCAEALNSRRPKSPPIEVWDFRGFTKYHAEQLADPDDGRPLRWHWEPLHFREELGDLLLARIFNSWPADDKFGVRLNSKNVERHLADLLHQREEYARCHPEQLKIVSTAEQIARSSSESHTAAR